MIVLWDVTEDRAVLVRGNKDLQLKDEILAESSSDGSHEPLDNLVDHEKEISSLCWVSADGSLLAVGYVDGDIFLWNLSASDHIKGHGAQKSSDKVVKIQLSSAERRLPVIVLHWSANKKRNGFGGQLFVYGGEEIGSEEVLTVCCESILCPSGLKYFKLYNKYGAKNLFLEMEISFVDTWSFFFAN